ncbi:MAG TPA: ATPase [Saprospiraceae bacterium]|nr:ATPase [Saprospiraceae bacterium]
MAKKKTDKNNALRPAAEELYKEELAQLAKEDTGQKPPNWLLSPPAVVQYILGGKLKSGFEIQPKYFGNQQLIEIAVATLVTDRALLLTGIPGTGKTWVAEHLAAAISGNSQLLVQGTSGISEEALRYGWNYAQLIAKGPSLEALVPSPIFVAMQQGAIARLEELTRIPADIQDALITILSEKVLPIPELNSKVEAQQGFNIIATANNRDRGINEMSSALRRRFNTVVMPLPASIKEEVKIVQTRVAALSHTYKLPVKSVPLQEIERLVTIFRELRSGITFDGSQKIKSPSSTLSTAEAISVISNSQALAVHFGNGKVNAQNLLLSMKGAIIKDPKLDTPIWEEYVETVIKSRKGWQDLYES